MKILLHFDDISKIGEEIIIEWLEELKGKRETPLRFCTKIEKITESESV